MSRIALSKYFAVSAFLLFGHAQASGQTERRPPEKEPAKANQFPEEIGVFDGPNESINQVRFSHDSNEITAVSDDPGLWVWNVSSRKLKFGVGVASFAREVRFARDDALVAVNSSIGPRIYDTDSGELELDLTPRFQGANFTRTCHAIIFSPDKKWVFFNIDTVLYRVEWKNFENGQFKTVNPNLGTIRGITISKDGKRVLTTHNESTAIVWDAEKLSEISRFSLHTDKVYDVDLTPDGKQAVTSSRDTSVYIWETNTGRLIKSLTGHQSGVKSVAFTPDGKWVVTGSYDKSIRLWNAATGKEVWKSLCANSNHIAISPNGRYLACGGGYISRFKKTQVIESHIITLFEFPERFWVKE